MQRKSKNGGFKMKGFSGFVNSPAKLHEPGHEGKTKETDYQKLATQRGAELVKLMTGVSDIEDNQGILQMPKWQKKAVKGASEAVKGASEAVSEAVTRKALKKAKPTFKGVKEGLVTGALMGKTMGKTLKPTEKIRRLTSKKINKYK
jgi:hypothetical protein